MTTGQEKTTQALKYCIQMEIDGKEFYLKACKESGNELGKKLLGIPCTAGRFPRQKFRTDLCKYQQITSMAAGFNFKPDAGQVLKNYFLPKQTKSTASQAKAANTEIEAIEKKRCEWKDKSYDLYHQRFEQAANRCRT